MNDYSVIIRQTVEYFDDLPYQINVLIVKDTLNKFIFNSHSKVIRVFDSNFLIESFMTIISSNQKEMLGFFTSDAFNIFSGNVNIEFSHRGGVQVIEDVDVSIIQPLDPLLASIDAPMGDNDWLNSLNI